MNIPQNCLIHWMDETDSEIVMDEARVQRIVDAALSENDISNAQLTVLFIDTATCCAMHADHFDNPDPTDVMTFPDGSFDPSTERTNLGDLAVCTDVAVELAPSHDHGPAEELTLYVLHGLLHILGYDDHDPADRTEMWEIQERLLAAEGITVSDS